MTTIDYRLEPNHEASLWLRNELQALGQDWLAGGGTNCSHLGLPMWATLWDHRLTCGSCFDDGMRCIEEPENHTCDRCRAVVDTIHIGALDCGWLVVVLGLCADCMDREVGR